MKFGVGIPTCRQGFDVPPGFCGAEEIPEVAKFAERVGVDFIWGSDFATPVPAMKQKHGAENLNWYEIVVSLSYCAAVTRRVGLGFGVIVLPFRDPVMLAKEISTLDVFSHGRVIFGVGLGAFRQEFELLFPHRAKANRAAMLEEGIQVMRRLFHEREVTFAGRYFPVQNVSFHPKPLQQPFPIHLSGRAEEVVNRVARYGDGWVMGPSPVAEVKDKLEKLKAATEQEQRDFSKLWIFADAALSLAGSREAALERFHKSFVGARFGKERSAAEILAAHYVGTPAEVAERIRDLERVGVTHVVAQHIAGDRYEELGEQIQMLAEEVMPLCR